MIPKVNNEYEHDVAIIGMGMRFPGPNNTSTKSGQELWNYLTEGSDLLSKLDPERLSQSFVDQEFISNNVGGFVGMNEWKSFDPMFFGITKKESEQIDPQIRQLMNVVWEAIEDAQLQYDKVRGSNTAVYIGTMTQGYKTILNHEITDISPYSLAGNILTFVSNRLSYAFDLRGPSMTLDTACSASLNAAFLGIQSIRSGASEMAVVGGCNDLLEPTPTISLSSLSALSKSGKCHSFDADADGYVRAEGCGVVILKKLSSAVRDGNRIYAVIKGGSSNVDGCNNKTTLTSPSGVAQAENVEFALKDAKLRASDIYYIEAHGTGTPVGDPTEVSALASVFAKNHSQENPLRIGSVKSNMGHLEAAAGVASLIKVCLMLKNRTLVPSINFKKCNPAIKCDEWNIKIQNQLEPLPNDKLIRMGINCFGLGGSNCHLILEEYKSENYNINENESNSINNKNYLIPFSACSKTSVDRYIGLIKSRIPELSKSVPFEYFVRHQIQSRSHFSANRKIVVASNWEEFGEMKRSYVSQQEMTANLASFSSANVKNPIVFVFCGQGPQYYSMGQELYECEPVFQRAVDECDGYLKEFFNYSVWEKLRTFKGETETDIHKPINAQPSIFLIQVGLVALYKSWGIEPSIVVGHSFGEVTAAYYANYISLHTAAKIVYYRATLQNDTIGSGRMLSIGIGADEYEKNYASQYPSLEIACFNSADSIVVTGSESVLQQLISELKPKSILAIMLTTPCSFHSSHQEAIKDRLLSSPIKSIDYINEDDSQSSPILFSTVTGTTFNRKEDYNIEYIYDNLRKPVVFDLAIENICKMIENQNSNKNCVFLEIAPHPTLNFYLKKLVQKSNTQNNSSSLVISSLNRKGNELETIQQTISQIYIQGVNIDLFTHQLQQQKSYDQDQWKDFTDCLPRYQWDSSLYWYEPLKSKRLRLEGPANNHLGNKTYNSTGGFSYLAVIDVGKTPFAFLKGHKIKGQSLFPGTGYVDNILRAFKGNDIYIHNLDFKYPFFLKEGVQNHLQSSFTEYAKNEYKVEFMVKENHHTDEWNRSAIGRISVYPSIDQQQDVLKLNMDEIKQKCNLATLTHDQVYQKIKASGIEFGSSFSRINTLLMGQDCCLSTINMKPQLSQFDCDTFFNTPILDSCAQGLIALVNATELVFEGVANMKIYSGNLPLERPDHIYVYVSLVNNSADTCIGQCKVLLEDGTVLMVGERMICHFLKKIEKDVPSHPESTLFSQAWQPKELLPSVINKTSTATKLNQYISQMISTASLKIKNKFIFKILDDNCIDNTQALIDSLEQLVKANNNIHIEYTLINAGADKQMKIHNQQRILFKCRDMVNLENLEKRLLKANYEIIITSDSKAIKPFESYLAPNGQILLINSLRNSLGNGLPTDLNNMVSANGDYSIIQNHSLQSQPDVKDINKIAFITSSSKPTDVESIFTDQGLLNCNKIETFESSTLVSNPEKFVKFVGDGSKSIVVFLAGLEELNVNNYQTRMFEYVKLNQLLLKNNITTCTVILTTNSAHMESNNFFNMSLIGIYRYFLEFNNVLPSISIDLSLETVSEVTLAYLIKLSTTPVDREYALRLEGSPNDLHLSVYVQRGFKEQINPTIDISQSDRFYCKLDSNLEYQFQPRLETLENNHVEVQVMATGVTEKDIQYHQQKLHQNMFKSGDIYSPPFGLEFSGIVSRVASNSKFKVGDHVVGLGFSSMSSHVIVRDDWIVEKPASLSFAEAAAIPVDYLTAYISTYVMGYLDESESILIHMANHGVGLALLNLLKSKNHQGKVFVTIDCDPSADILKQFSGLITQAFHQVDSTHIDNGFSDQIKSFGGVDLLINSLPGSFMKSNFDCLTPSGRIIDLAANHLLENDNLNIKNFTYHHGYQTFYVDQLLLNQSKLLNRHLTHVIKSFKDGQIEIINPIRSFQSNQIKDAFQEHEKQQRKIIIDFGKFESQIVSNLQASGKLNDIINSTSKMTKIGETLLITGQTGIAVLILRWIIENQPIGLKDIIVLSKSNLKWELQYLINQNKSNKNSSIRIHYRSVDVANYLQLEQSVDSIYQSTNDIAPVSSVIHFATIYDYCETQLISQESLSGTHNAKAVGAYNLHLLTENRKFKVNSFILFSSVFAVFGSSNQSAYTSANAVLDGLAHYRRSRGLAALSVNWGALAGGGEVVNNKSVSQFLKLLGFDMVSVSHILGGMKLFLNETIEKPQVMIVEMAYKSVFEQYRLMKAKLEHLSVPKDIDFETVVQTNSSANDASTSIFNMVTYKVADLLSVEPTKINQTVSLKDYGIDSLLTVQLKNWIQKEFNVSNITPKEITNSSINTLIQSIKV